MFTGIIEHQGEVVDLKRFENQLTLNIETNFDDMSEVELGDSIAMNGVCLTVTKIDKSVVEVDLSNETIYLTNAKHWEKGTKLNLEKSLRLNDKLGGHMVSGHVDGIAKVSHIEPVDETTIFGFEVDPKFMKYVVKKGSVALNGVSLTVNEVKDNQFFVCLIPHSLEITNLSDLKLGDEINFEIDTIARYVENMMKFKD